VSWQLRALGRPVVSHQLPRRSCRTILTYIIRSTGPVRSELPRFRHATQAERAGPGPSARDRDSAARSETHHPRRRTRPDCRSARMRQRPSSPLVQTTALPHSHRGASAPTTLTLAVAADDEERSRLEPRDCCWSPRTRKCTAACTTLPSTGPGFQLKAVESSGRRSRLETVAQSAGARP